VLGFGTMRRSRGLGQGVGIIVLVLLVGLSTSASASTTVRTFAGSPYFTAHPALAVAPPVTIGAHVVAHFGGVATAPAAGVQGTSPGLEGTTVVLASCAARCTDRYRPASAPVLPTGHYTERVTFTVVQPAHTGQAVGFDVDVGVQLTTGWVFGVGYFSTGVATGAAPSTVTVRLYIDLGAAAPTVSAVEVTVNPCVSTTGCP
jgi:hypothetical protein